MKNYLSEIFTDFLEMPLDKLHYRAKFQSNVSHTILAIQTLQIEALLIVMTFSE